MKFDMKIIAIISLSIVVAVLALVLFNESESRSQVDWVTEELYSESCMTYVAEQECGDYVSSFDSSSEWYATGYYIEVYVAYGSLEARFRAICENGEGGSTDPVLNEAEVRACYLG